MAIGTLSLNQGTVRFKMKVTSGKMLCYAMSTSVQPVRILDMLNFYTSAPYHPLTGQTEGPFFTHAAKKGPPLGTSQRHKDN